MSLLRNKYYNFIQIHFYKCCHFLLFFLFIFPITSCSTIAGIFSTPSYSIHSSDKIQIENSKSNIRKSYNKVYIRNNTSDTYKIGEKVVKNVKNSFIDSGINITNNIEDANYIVSVNIKDVIVDIDGDFARKIRNALAQNGLNPYYEFDKNNAPSITIDKIGDIKMDGKNMGLRGRSMVPSVLFPLLGAGVGFTAGYFIGASISPIGIGFAGAVLVGGVVHLLYQSFKEEGVIVIYEIVIEEKTNKWLNHNRKIINKTSANSSEDTFFSYSDQWVKYSSKNAVIAIGSRALRKKMIDNICPMISKNVSSVFE